MSGIAERPCSLQNGIGVLEFCTCGCCPFWEPGGAVVEGGCLTERIGVDVRDVELARYLLEVRHHLEEVRDKYAAEAAQLELSRRVGLEL
ncbi:MAG: hypothetical protein QOH23_332 [Gaiellaceae bacterium]|nr:hypothetical protein [Gaiellaceae bacterium]